MKMVDLETKPFPQSAGMLKISKNRKRKKVIALKLTKNMIKISFS